MSPVRFEQRLYKVFEPDYHPIIVDEAIESPETLTIRLEEEAARANSGEFGGDSPTGYLSMATFKPLPPQLDVRSDEFDASPPFSPYTPAPSYTTQHTEDGGANLNQVRISARMRQNQLAFSANSAGSYLTGEANVSSDGINILESRPSIGGAGTPVSIKVSSEFDILAMTASGSYATVMFASHRCMAQVKQEAINSDGSSVYTITAEAPNLQYIFASGVSPSSVPLTLVVENGAGEELARVDSAGLFAYGQEVQSGGGAANAAPNDLSPRASLSGQERKSPGSRPSPSQGLKQENITVGTSSDVLPAALRVAADTSTNTYGLPPGIAEASSSIVQAQAQVSGVVHGQQQAQAFAAATAHSVVDPSAYHSVPTGGSMLRDYRTSSYADPYSRGPPPLRSDYHAGGWSAYGSHSLEPLRGHTSTLPQSSGPVVGGRHGIWGLGSDAPSLQRTSTLTQQTGCSSVTPTGYPSPLGFNQDKATLEIIGDLDGMASINEWTDEEYQNKRRIVLFKKRQHGSGLTLSFKPVSVAERPPNSICISCIWWAEKQECYVTSVDTMNLLEQLLYAPVKFPVEEKNRIRRNLEGFHPITVSKAKSESEEFFKLIMHFSAPKPRNIEKDIKVYRWKKLSHALRKIVSKYSVTPANRAMHHGLPASLPPSLPPALPPSLAPVAPCLPPAMPPSTPTQLLTPVSLSGSYPPLHPAPGVSTTAAEHVGAPGYLTAPQHHQIPGHQPYPHHNDPIPSPRSLSGSSASWAAYSASGRVLSPGTKGSHPSIQGSSLRISTLTGGYEPAAHAPVTSPYCMPALMPPSPHHAQARYEPYNYEGAYAGVSPASQAYRNGAYDDGAQRA